MTQKKLASVAVSTSGSRLYQRRRNCHAAMLKQRAVKVNIVTQAIPAQFNPCWLAPVWRRQQIALLFHRPRRRLHSIQPKNLILTSTMEGQVTLLPVGSKWKIDIQNISSNPNIVEVTSSTPVLHGERFVAQYVNSPEPPQFTGELWTREATAFFMRAKEPLTSPTHPHYYVAFFIGLLVTNTHNKFTGKFCDVAGSYSNFTLTRLS